MNSLFWSVQPWAFFCVSRNVWNCTIDHWNSESREIRTVMTDQRGCMCLISPPFPVVGRSRISPSCEAGQIFHPCCRARAFLPSQESFPFILLPLCLFFPVFFARSSSSVWLITESFLPFHPLLWLHSHLYLLLMHNHHVQVTHRFETLAYTFPLSCRPTYLAHIQVLLAPRGCQKHLEINVSKCELITSSPELVLSQCSIFQHRDPPFVQLNKVETQDLSLILPPLLPTPCANLFSGSLTFYFCKSALFFHPCLNSSVPFQWPPLCSTCVYP